MVRESLSNEPKVELVDFLTIEFDIIAPLVPSEDFRLIFGFDAMGS